MRNEEHVRDLIDRLRAAAPGMEYATDARLLQEAADALEPETPRFGPNSGLMFESSDGVQIQRSDGNYYIRHINPQYPIVKVGTLNAEALRELFEWEADNE